MLEPGIVEGACNRMRSRGMDECNHEYVFTPVKSAARCLDDGPNRHDGRDLNMNRMSLTSK